MIDYKLTSSDGHLLGVDDAALSDIDVPELPETGHIDVTRARVSRDWTGHGTIYVCRVECRITC